MIAAKTAKLRILSLAFRGKLVNYSQKEKQNTSLESLHKAQKSFLAVSEAECLTDIPSYWNWSRLGYVTNNHGQTVPDKDFCYIDVGTLDNVHQRLAAAENLVTAKDAPSRARKIVHVGDVLYSTVRPYLHNICIVDREFSRTPIASTAFCVMHANGSVLVNKFLFYWLLTKEFDAFSNGDSSKGTLYPAIGEKDLLRGVIPIPPLAEQKRIVAKIEQAFSALDTIDAFQAKYADNLAVLKSKLIDAAIRGKLTDQLPEDGTAEELYRQIQAEKQALIKAGKIKKEKLLPEITADEIPFDIPKSWKWARLGNLMLDVSTGPFGSMLHESDYCEGGIPLVNPMHIQNGAIHPSDKMRVSPSTLERLSQYRLSEGMIVVARRGDLGRCARIGKSENGWICGTGCFFLNPSRHVFSPFITLVISSPFARSVFKGTAIGTTMANLNHNLLKGLPFPLPPLAEQKRIVERVSELLTVCDELKIVSKRMEL